jgi:hypothetical protein
MRIDLIILGVYILKKERKMRISKLCILACCVGVSGAAFLAPPLAAQDNQSTAASDQAKALEALRKAEAEPVVPDVIGTRANTPAPVVAPAPVTSTPIAAPAPAVTPVVTLPPPSEDQAKALEALRKAETEPVTTDQNAPATPTVAPAPSPVAVAPQDKEAQVIEAQRQRDLELAAERDRLARDKADAAQQASLDAQKRADEKARMAKAQADAERLKKQMQSTSPNAPLAPAETGPISKEQKLANLLRLYQADEITPYEYHTQRAKIIAEP